MGLLSELAKATGKNLLDEPMSKKTLDSLVFETDKARKKMENSAPGEFDNNWQNYLELRKQRDQAYKDFENQPVSTDRLERARQQGFNTDQVWYHGTKRLDRVLEGDSLKPSRATSGPMPFFTDSPELASGYTRKTDTSIGGAGDYEDWFRVSVGKGRAKNLNNVFANLSPQKRLEVREKIRNIGEDENGNISLSGNSIVSQDHWDYTLREYGNDPIKAAQDIWLNSGNLYDAEEKFIKVLKLAGIDKKIEFKDPWAEHPGILPVFARVNNPLDTGDTNALVQVLARLEEAGKNKRYKKQKLGVDPWDKSQIGIREFTDRLREDLERGTTYAWTSVPDDVTKELKDHFGYDGILDNSGKFKKDPGNQNKVLIPFNVSDVRSVNAQFDPKKTDSKNLLASPVPVTMGAGLLSAQAIPTVKDKAVAVGETLLDAGQAMIAPIAAAPHALIPALLSDRPTAQIEQGYQNLLQQMDYEPSTQLGQEYSQAAQQFMGDAFNAAAQSAPGQAIKQVVEPINLLIQQAPERARLVGRSLLDMSPF